MKKIYLKYAIALVGGLSVLNSCVKEDEWSTPPINCNNKFAAPNISLADFVAQSPASGAAPKKITTDMIFDAYVVSSDEQGNFYKTISFQDKPENPTVGLQIEVNKSSNFADLPVGSHIRINANGLVLGYDRGVIKIGAVDPDYPIGRVPEVLVGRYISGVCNGNGIEVVKLVPLELPNFTEAKKDKYINQLVKVNNVQFADGEIGKKYINYDSAGAGVDTDRSLVDDTNITATLRTSGFAKFGSTLLPKEKGDITFVVGKYNSNYQMAIRNLADVHFTGPRYDSAPPKGGTALAPSGAFTEDFESYATTPANLDVFPKYVNDAAIGNRYWQLKTFGGNKYIQLGANSGSGQYETYFIVPVDFTAANSMSFKVNVGFWNGAALSVYTTTNYTPLGDISNATLADITSNFTVPQVPTTGYGASFSPAGTYNFPASLTGNGYVVFKYTGNGTGVTTTIQLDDIVVQ